jgi:hypothetical protein
MVKKLHACFTAVLLCGAVGLAAPALAAGQHKAIHHAAAVKHKAAKMPNEARLNQREHEITEQLNRQSLTNGQHADAATTAIADASVTEDDFIQQAFLEDDE